MTEASGKGHLKGSKVNKSWDEEATEVGGKNFAPVDLFQEGRE